MIRLWTVSAATAVFIATVAHAASQDAKRSTWDGVYTDAQAARGAALYSQHCASCHAPTLTGAEAPPLTGVDFTSSWNGLTVADLVDRVRTTMPLNDPGALTAQEAADAVAHILSVGKFPAGMTELPRDAAMLRQITFAASKP